MDVSSWQEDIDWAKAKADGVEFAIIRAGYRGWGSAGNPGKDPYLIKNIEGAQAQGIRVVYIFILRPLHRMRQDRKLTG